MTDLEQRVHELLEQAAEAPVGDPPVDVLVHRGRRRQQARVSGLISVVALVTTAIVLTAMFVPGRDSGAPKPLGPTPAVDASPRARAQAEVARLLRQAIVPPGAVALRSAPSPSAADAGRMTPAVDTVVTASRYWRVPMEAGSALAWLREHPPAGLTPFSSTVGGVGGNPAYGLVGYSEAPPPGLDEPQLQETMIPVDGHTSVLRVDATVIWLDSRPFRDTTAGPRLRITVAKGCPRSDARIVGVTNPGAGLDRSLLPNEPPTSALICDYVGGNGDANSLLRHTRLGATASRQLAAFINTIQLAHPDGGVVSCGMDDGAYTVLVFAYPGRPAVDVWWNRGGCQPVGNGHIVSSGAARAGLSGAVARAERQGK